MRNAEVAVRNRARNDLGYQHVRRPPATATLRGDEDGAKPCASGKHGKTPMQRSRRNADHQSEAKRSEAKKRLMIKQVASKQTRKKA